MGNGGARRDEHLASHVTAFLFTGQLVLEMNTRRAGFDHRLGQFEDVQRTTESRLRVGDDWNKPVDIILAFGVLDLICTLQRLIDPFHDRRHAVRRIQALIGIHLAGEISVGSNLPSAKIDCL